MNGGNKIKRKVIRKREWDQQTVRVAVRLDKGLSEEGLNANLAQRIARIIHIKNTTKTEAIQYKEDMNIPSLVSKAK